MIIRKNNNNLFKGKFKENELKNYVGLTDKDIRTILDYQKKLPILQEDNKNWINTRILHKQLGVNKKYADWVKQQVEDLELNEGEKYYIKWLNKDNKSFPFKGKAQYSPQKIAALGYSKNYFTTIETAKEIAMIAGAKGSRTGKELKEKSKLARKYFIAIEKAFELRYDWNSQRYKSIEMFHELKSAIIKKKDELEKYLPDWWRNRKGICIYECHILNMIIIGMSAKEFKKRNGLNKNDTTRNYFNEDQLYRVHKLEEYDAILLDINNISDTNERIELLDKYHKEKLM